MSQISHTSYCSNGKGVAVKISLDNLTDLEEKKEQIIDMISKLFEQYGIASTSEKVKIYGDEFIQACISCLNDKKEVSALEFCDPEFNKYLPKNYVLVCQVDNKILNFEKKQDLLHTLFMYQYEKSSKKFFVKEV